MEGALGPGTVLLGKYRVESVLGRGGMGVVLKVTHLQLGEELAVKVLLPEGATSPEVTARFLREAQSVVRLRGEHVARVSDIGVLPEGLPFIVMEYLRGVDLAGELKRRRQLAPGEAVDYVLQACEALAEAHAHGIVHRDIKPANLFLTKRPDGTPLVKVLDFGISKAPITASGVVTRTDTVMGTAGYMSPEQMKAARDVDARTDIWALGIVLYECLNGRRPFEGESFSAVVLMSGTEPPPPMDPRLPRALQATVLRCLEKDRRARFSSIAELAAALAPFARDQRAAAIVVDRTNLMRQRPGSAAEPLVPEHAPAATTLSGSAGPTGSRTPGRRYMLATVLMLGSLVVLVSTAVAISRRSHPSDDGFGTQPSTSATIDATSPTGALIVAPEPPRDAEQTVTTTIAFDASGITPHVVDADDGKAQRLAQCAELSARRKWQDLVDCAAGLEALGLRDKAKELSTMALQETRNEATDGKVRDALRGGRLKEAQSLLRGISQDSVYHRSLSDLFDRADAINLDEARRRSQSYVTMHDCAGLKRYLALQSTGASGTDNAIALVKEATARCTEKSDPAPAGAKPPVGKASNPRQPEPKEQLWNADSPFLPDIPAPSGNGSAAAPPPAPPVPTPAYCEGLDSNDELRDPLVQAANQYKNGFPNAALSLILKALNCKQDVRMYRLATMYACGAHVQATARLYFAKLPLNMQSGVEQRCQQEGLNVRAP